MSGINNQNTLPTFPSSFSLSSFIANNAFATPSTSPSLPQQTVPMTFTIPPNMNVSPTFQTSFSPQTTPVPAFTMSSTTLTPPPAPVQTQLAPQKPQFATIQLREYQKPHYDRLMKMLDKNFFATDGSEMGLGKTIVGIQIALTRNLPVVVVAPTAARAVWYNEMNKYGCPYFNINGGPVITYESLRGTKKYPPKHGLLDRHDVIDHSLPSKPLKTVFNPTTTLHNMIDAGILFIFDECHKAKNKSDQNDAVRAIIQAIYSRGGRSRFLLSSGTPMDKSTQVITFLRTINFIRHRNLYTMTNGTPKMEGINELNQWAIRLAPEKAYEFMSRRMSPAPRNKKTSAAYVIDMFLEVLKPEIMSIMIKSNTGSATKDVKNGYYILDEEQNAIYKEGVKTFTSILRYDPITGEVDRSRLKDAVETLHKMQKAKTKAMIRVARELLSKPDENGNWRKVALFADYFDCIDEMKEGLKDFNPLELTGNVNQNKRPGIVELFQQPNHNHRLLIANPLVGGIAISLHDTDGRFPRYALIMPGFRINELLQTVGRFDRDGIVGVAIVRFFYGLSGTDESNVFESLVNKGEFMSKLLAEQKVGKQRFPNDYESVIEGNQTVMISDIVNKGVNINDDSNDDDDNESDDFDVSDK